MSITAELMFCRQDFDELEAICPLDDIGISTLPAEKLTRYKELLEALITLTIEIDEDLALQALAAGRIQLDMPREHKDFYLGKLKPAFSKLLATQKKLDPEQAELNELFAARGRLTGGSNEQIFNTLMAGLEKIEQAKSDWPDDAGELWVEEARAIMFSHLIDFNPDRWIDNAGKLRPISTALNGNDLPVQLRRHLRELYRAYVFENWISVSILARSVLEYALVDNLHKLGIAATVTVTIPRQKTQAQMARRTGR